MSHSAAPSLTLALVWSPHDAVGSLPGLVVVERCAALAVVASCVVSAHTLPVDLSSKYHGQDRVFFLVVSVFLKRKWTFLKLRLSVGLTFRRSLITFCADASCSHPVLHTATRFSTLDEVKPQVPVCKELRVTFIGTIPKRRSECELTGPEASSALFKHGSCCHH